MSQSASAPKTLTPEEMVAIGKDVLPSVFKSTSEDELRGRLSAIAQDLTYWNAFIERFPEASQYWFDSSKMDAFLDQVHDAYEKASSK